MAPSRWTRRRCRRRMAVLLLVLLGAIVLTAVTAQGGDGSTTPEPAPEPSSSTPTVTTSAPSTPTPTPSPSPTSKKPTTPKTPEPSEATETPAPTTKEVEPKADNSTDSEPTTAPTPAPQGTVENGSMRPGSTLTPGSTPDSNAVYGDREGGSGSSENTSTSTSKGDVNKSLIQFVSVAGGCLGFILVAAISVYIHRKHQASSRQDDYDDDDKFLSNPGNKRPTTLQMDTRPPATTTAAFDNYTTPMNAQTMRPQHVQVEQTNPLAVSAFRDTDKVVNTTTNTTTTTTASKYQAAPPVSGTGIVATAATAGVAATFLARDLGENDVTGDDGARSTPALRANPLAQSTYQEDFRGTASMRITKCRGNSEDETATSSRFPHRESLIATSGRTTADSSALDNSYHKSQMFAFSDSESEDDNESVISVDHGAPSDLSDLGQYYDASISSEASYDVDVDIDGGSSRESRASSLTDHSYYMTDGMNRVSTSSSIAEFHDESATRERNYSQDEFEV